MTNEELIQAFPECEKVKRNDMRQCIIDAIEQEKFYCVASTKVYNKAHELWPYDRKWKDEDAEHQAYKLYFWGDWHGTESPFDVWLRKTFEEEFIARHGEVHTFEACQIAADEWTRMIFGAHMQNNGDQSDAGGMSMILGTLAKEHAKEGISSDVIENFRKLCRDYYHDGCRAEEDKYGWRKEKPYCDYHPNGALAKLLLDAGVPRDKVGNIAPWKTGISINERDHAVRIGGYQTERYI